MGFFDKIKRGLTRTKESLIRNIESVVIGYAEIDDDFLEDLEMVLLSGDIGVRTTDYLMRQIRRGVTEGTIHNTNEVMPFMEKTVKELLKDDTIDQENTHHPEVILVVGVNGVGKTTTIGKLSGKLHKEGKKVLLAAADTFRAAASEQLTIWAERTGADIVKHAEGADPAAVAFDAVSAAKARGVDVVLIDTAGRLHTSPELMRELAKVVNVTRKRAANMAAGPMPVSVVLVIDAATGQNGLNQALEFNEALGLDGIIMTKLDGTAKGGIAMAVAEKLKLPILRIGVGEQVDDLQEFNAKDFCRALVGESN